MGYLTEVCLILCGFALLAQREKVLVTTPKVIRQTKIGFDTALAVVLLILSMARVGLSIELQSQTEINIYLAYPLHQQVDMTCVILISY